MGETEKKSMNYAEKRHHLTGKIIEGAKALNELFDRSCSPFFFAFHSPKRYCKHLSEKYGLTRNQQEYLKIVGHRLWHAHEIVKLAKRSFGVSRGEKIKDADGLFRAVYPDINPDSALVYAKGEPFWLVFYLKEKHFSPKTAGTVEGTGFDQTLESHILDLAVPETIDKKYRLICSKINNSHPYNSAIDEYTQDVKKRDLLEKILLEDTENHELKHIIDKIASMQKYIYNSEMSAYMFENGDIRTGLEIDIKMAGERAESFNKKHTSHLERLGYFIARKIRNNELSAERKREKLDDIKNKISLSEGSDKESWEVMYEWVSNPEKSQDKIISDLRRYDVLHKHAARSLASLQKVDPERLSSIISDGLRNKVLSFIISTTPVTKLPERISLLENYLNKQNINLKKI